MSPFGEFGLSSALDQRLQSLGDDIAGRLGGISRIVNLPANATIFVEGNEAEHVFAVSTGIVRVFKLLRDGRRQITCFVFAGDFLGVNFNDRYQFGAEKATATSLLAIQRRALERMIEELPGVGRMFLSNVASELEAAQDRMLLLGRKRASERVASFLLMLARRQAPQAPGTADRIGIPLGWGDIADHLGLSPETVSRCLSTFRHEGILRIDHRRHEIEVMNWERLERLSGEGS